MNAQTPLERILKIRLRIFSSSPKYKAAIDDLAAAMEVEYGIQGVSEQMKLGAPKLLRFLDRHLDLIQKNDDKDAWAAAIGKQ